MGDNYNPMYMDENGCKPVGVIAIYSEIRMMCLKPHASNTWNS